MRRLGLILTLLAVSVASACLAKGPSGPTREIPYAVIYGRIGAPKLTRSMNVAIAAYADSQSALKSDTLGLRGGFTQQVDSLTVADSANYYAFLGAVAPATYYLNVWAYGIGQTGYVGSVDTIRALKVRFDSLNGGPHDSVAVNDSLP